MGDASIDDIFASLDTRRKKGSKDKRRPRAVVPPDALPTTNAAGARLCPSAPPASKDRGSSIDDGPLIPVAVASAFAMEEEEVPEPVESRPAPASAEPVAYAGDIISLDTGDAGENYDEDLGTALPASLRSMLQQRQAQQPPSSSPEPAPSPPQQPYVSWDPGAPATGPDGLPLPPSRALLTMFSDVPIDTLLAKLARPVLTSARPRLADSGGGGGGGGGGGVLAKAMKHLKRQRRGMVAADEALDGGMAASVRAALNRAHGVMLPVVSDARSAGLASSGCSEAPMLRNHGAVPRGRTAIATYHSSGAGGMADIDPPTTTTTSATAPAAATVRALSPASVLELGPPGTGPRTLPPLFASALPVLHAKWAAYATSVLFAEAGRLQRLRLADSSSGGVGVGGKPAPASAASSSANPTAAGNKRVREGIVLESLLPPSRKQQKREQQRLEEEQRQQQQESAGDVIFEIGEGSSCGEAAVATIPFMTPTEARAALSRQVLASLDWRFAHLTVVRCADRPLVGTSGFVLRAGKDNLILAVAAVVREGKQLGGGNRPATASDAAVEAARVEVATAAKRGAEAAAAAGDASSPSAPSPPLVWKRVGECELGWAGLGAGGGMV